MATCSKTSTYTNILDLPSVTNIANGDLLIVQTGDITATIDFEDVLIPLENTTFGGTISAQSAQITQNSTNIGVLCGRVAQLANDLLNVTTYDSNPVTIQTIVSSAGGGGGGTTSRTSILAAMSSSTPSFPWRTLQKVKTNLQDVPASPKNGGWTTIDGLDVNITRSTSNSYVRVQCAISTGIKDLGHAVGMRIIRGSIPIGVGEGQETNVLLMGATAARANNISTEALAPIAQTYFNAETTSFEFIDTLTGISDTNLTYRVQVRSIKGLYINRPSYTTSAYYGFNPISTITVTELI